MSSQEITPVYCQILVKVFEAEGSTVSHQRSDHLILTKPGVGRPVMVKISPHEVPVTYIVTNLRTTGISRERYFVLLDQVR